MHDHTSRTYLTHRELESIIVIVVIIIVIVIITYEVRHFLRGTQM